MRNFQTWVSPVVTVNCSQWGPQMSLLLRWDSRTLDIDIITFGSTLKATKNLTLPHPRAYERAFVLVPWMLLDPEAVLPGHGSVAKLAADLPDQVVVIE